MVIHLTSIKRQMLHYSISFFYVIINQQTKCSLYATREFLLFLRLLKGSIIMYTYFLLPITYVHSAT